MFDNGSTDSGEGKPFLSQEEHCPELHSRELSPKPRRRHFITIFLHLALILLYTIISIVVIRLSSEKCSQPAQVLSDLSIKYGSQVFQKMHDSPYVGAPSVPLDKAWQDLLANMSIRVTKSELEHHGQSSVALPGGGHLAWLGVFHQLHCVKMLRQLNYQEHYHPNMTVKETRDWQVHADHCLELLRAATMCHADTTSLTTFMWQKSEKPMLSNQRPPHQCVDWDELVASTGHRIVSSEELESLKNPLLHGEVEP